MVIFKVFYREMEKCEYLITKDYAQCNLCHNLRLNKALLVRLLPSYLPNLIIAQIESQTSESWFKNILKVRNCQCCQCKKITL